jgi:hypothetical protein
MFHPIKICNECNTNICYKCFISSYSKLKSIDGKNIYNNDPLFIPDNNTEFNNAILCELKCKNKNCERNSGLINIYNDVNKKITKHELENKQFYKWKKLQDMLYFEKGCWRLDYNTLDDNIQKNINKISKSIPDNIIKNYTFTINYKPDKDIFIISLNPVLIKQYNSNNSNKILLQYPYNNELFVNTVYNGLQQLMIYYIFNGYNKDSACDTLFNLDIRSLINGYNNYVLEFMNILKDYKASNNMCIDSYKCNNILNTLKNGYNCNYEL